MTATVGGARGPRVARQLAVDEAADGAAAVDEDSPDVLAEEPAVVALDPPEPLAESEVVALPLEAAAEERAAALSVL